MKKMKYPFGIILSFVLLFTGCKFDDGDIWKELEKHTERIAALEAWQQTVNTNINALQGLVSALENNDYVTGVIPVKEGSVEIGYTITFTKSPSITIYHGDKGDKGDSGATPEIGVGQDTDGKYYWMLNGEWLLDGADKIPATGDKGDKGEGAPAPRIRINTETNFWEISTDGGTEWASTGVKATGEKGEQGDAVFAKDGIDFSDDDFVVFTLTDGTTITLDKYKGLSIVFPDAPDYLLEIQEGSSVSFSYTVLGTLQGIGISGQLPDGWIVSVDKEQSTLNVAVPFTAASAQILLVATGEKGASASYWLNFEVKPTSVYAGRFGGSMKKGVDGVWQFDKDLYVAMENAATNVSWSTGLDLTGINDPRNGKKNTYDLMAIGPDFSPAAGSCFKQNNNWEDIESETADNYHWFLPSQSQAITLWGINGGLGDHRLDKYVVGLFYTYWTSTESSRNGSIPNYAQNIDFNTARNTYGQLGVGHKTNNTYNIRCIREAEPQGAGPKVYLDEDERIILEFTGMPDGTVTDESKNADPTTAQSDEKVYRKLEIAPYDLNTKGELSSTGDFGITWDDATSKAAKLGQGWRLPTRREIYFMWVFREAVDGIAGEMGAGKAALLNPTSDYWSATLTSTSGAGANRFYLYCNFGNNGSGSVGSTYSAPRVRLVREVQ